MSVESTKRCLAMLRTALGEVTQYLDSDVVTDIMLNADGAIWVKEIGKVSYRTGITLTQEAADKIIRLVASAADDEVSADKPRLAAKLPYWGARVQASIPPYSVDGPVFSLRLPAKKIFTLDEYVAAGIMSDAQASFLRGQIIDKENILVSGGTGSGKSTLTNALLNEIAGSTDRVVLIEDNLELQCPVENMIRKLVMEPATTLQIAIMDALREYPDRIIVGEVRDHTACDLITIWNTGHPGNLCTLHADSAVDSLDRINRLAQRAHNVDFRPEIGKAVGACVNLEEDAGHPAGRRVNSLIQVHGFEEEWIFSAID